MIGWADIALAAVAATLIYLCCFRPWPHEEARERQACVDELLDGLWDDDQVGAGGASREWPHSLASVGTDNFRARDAS